MNKEYILQEIERTTKINGGKPLGIKRFEDETGIKSSEWYGKYWSKWSDALKEAGYEPNTLQQPYEDDYLVQKLIDLIREIGKFPSDGDLRLKSYNDKTFPNNKTFERWNKSEKAQKIVDYCEKHTQLADIIEICKPICNSDSKEIKDKRENVEENVGYVYLMKSGKHYKIGRSNSADRRSYEIGIQLPEKLQLIHKIRTDDPVGIEAYWHKRFEDKRKNGEWFELNGSDVQVFRRRKFM